MAYITLMATRNTWLKSDAIDLSLIPDKPQSPEDLCKYPVEAGKLLKLDKLSLAVGGHYLIETSDDPDFPYQRLFAYGLHWAMIDTESPNLIEQEPLLKPSRQIQQQIDLLQAYVLASDQKVKLSTPTKYFSQRDDYTMKHRTCNSSSNAMYLDWLLRVTGRGLLQSDNEYLAKVLWHGDTIYHVYQTKAIAEYGFATEWRMDADYELVQQLIAAGFPVVVNILSPSIMAKPKGGHVVLLIGRREGQWIAHDPYGTIEADYRLTNGAYSKIGDREFLARWQGGFRILV